MFGTGDPEVGNMGRDCTGCELREEVGYDNTDYNKHT